MTVVIGLFITSIHPFFFNYDYSCTKRSGWSQAKLSWGEGRTSCQFIAGPHAKKKKTFTLALTPTVNSEFPLCMFLDFWRKQWDQKRKPRGHRKNMNTSHWNIWITCAISAMESQLHCSAHRFPPPALVQFHKEILVWFSTVNAPQKNLSDRSGEIHGLLPCLLSPKKVVEKLLHLSRMKCFNLLL